jgi:hypothetical protein
MNLSLTNSSNLLKPSGMGLQLVQHGETMQDGAPEARRAGQKVVGRCISVHIPKSLPIRLTPGTPRCRGSQWLIQNHCGAEFSPGGR